MSAEPHGQGVGDDVVPAGVRRNPTRFDQHIAVKPLGRGIGARVLKARLIS